MRLKIAAISDRGKIRSGNEDNLFLCGEILPESHNETITLEKTVTCAAGALVGVFDGMGGYSCGETASFLAASAAGSRWKRKKRGTDVEKMLLQICEDANTAVCEEMERRSGARMGATAAMLHVSGTQYHICNVGDSPIFLLRDGEMQEISVEHTERATYEAVTGTKSDAKKKFNLTQHIGMFPEDMIPEPHCAGGVLRAEDTFLLCSDGVTDMLDREEIKEFLRGKDAAAAAKALAQAALAAGGRDNITAVVVRCEKRRGLLSRLLTKKKRKGVEPSGT